MFRNRCKVQGRPPWLPDQVGTVADPAVKEDGRKIDFEVIARLDTEVDVAYFENNGILPYLLRKVIGEN